MDKCSNSRKVNVSGSAGPGSVPLAAGYANGSGTAGNVQAHRTANRSNPFKGKPQHSVTFNASFSY